MRITFRFKNGKNILQKKEAIEEPLVKVLRLMKDYFTPTVDITNNTIKLKIYDSNLYP